MHEYTTPKCLNTAIEPTQYFRFFKFHVGVMKEGTICIGIENIHIITLLYDGGNNCIVITLLNINHDSSTFVATVQLLQSIYISRFFFKTNEHINNLWVNT